MSLIEVIFYIGILSFTAALTIPSFNDWLKWQHEQQELQQCFMLITQIRDQALIRHQNQFFCVSFDGLHCASSGNYLLFLDEDEKQVKSKFRFKAFSIDWHGFPPRDVLSFAKFGIPKENGRFYFCNQNSHRIMTKTIVLSMTGQIRVEPIDEQKNCK